MLKSLEVFSSFFTSTFEEQAEGGALEAEKLAQLIFEVAPIGKMG